MSWPDAALGAAVASVATVVVMVLVRRWLRKRRLASSTAAAENEMWDRAGMYALRDTWDNPHDEHWDDLTKEGASLSKADHARMSHRPTVAPPPSYCGISGCPRLPTCSCCKEALDTTLDKLDKLRTRTNPAKTPSEDILRKARDEEESKCAFPKKR